ncbi:MAG TPA: two-component regulator propeller domain-containing protein, partial [Saprospiraceae bacterium]|nr:two-component regulator propeller domain-containing protein [Saprospiraceae bacterium]
KDFKLNSNTIKCIFEDSKKNIWIGTDNGLHLYNENKDNFTRYLHEPSRADAISSNHITCITQDKQSKIWVGTLNGGINVMEGLKNSF